MSLQGGTESMGMVDRVQCIERFEICHLFERGSERIPTVEPLQFSLHSLHHGFPDGENEISHRGQTTATGLQSVQSMLSKIIDSVLEEFLPRADGVQVAAGPLRMLGPVQVTFGVRH